MTQTGRILFFGQNKKMAKLLSSTATNKHETQNGSASFESLC